MNQRFQNAINRREQKTPPIWMMRQAGRYHQHYQQLRLKHSFEELCKMPKLAAEVARGPVADFDFDVAILFSDILFPLEGLGTGLQYTEQGPKLSQQLSSENIKNLKSPSEAACFLLFQGEAMRATRAVLPAEKSLIGFVGGLWTLFVYAVEGSHSGALITSKKNPRLFHQFMEIMVPLMKANIKDQLDSGAEVVMIFDTAAGELSSSAFKAEVESYLLQLANHFPGQLGYYSRGTQPDFFTNEFLQAPWAGMGVDHRWNLSTAFALRNTGFLQGNFDQSLLFQEPEVFRNTLEKYLQNVKSVPLAQRMSWVCALGHGVLPKTPEENVRYFVRRSREVFS